MVVEETRTHPKRAGTFDAATTLEGDLRRFLSPMLRRAADRSIARHCRTGHVSTRSRMRLAYRHTCICELQAAMVAQPRRNPANPVKGGGARDVHSRCQSIGST